MNLTPKQDNFCRLYIELGNASEAYRQAYDAAMLVHMRVVKGAVV